MAEKRTTYKLQDVGGIGEVKIADEVVTVIAGLAATDVDGVASMEGNITNELVSKLGVKNLSKGVKVTVLEGVVTVDLTLNIEFGKNILEVSKKVQDKVKSSIENMTGLEVADVNIRIAGVDMENEKGNLSFFLYCESTAQLCFDNECLRGQTFPRRKYAKKRAERTYF